MVLHCKNEYAFFRFPSHVNLESSRKKFKRLQTWSLSHSPISHTLATSIMLCYINLITAEISKGFAGFYKSFIHHCMLSVLHA